MIPKPNVPDVPEPDVPNSDVTLIIGPMSGGDKVQIKNKAIELNVPVIEQKTEFLLLANVRLVMKRLLEEIAGKSYNYRLL